jgi:hypothetical protein
LAIAANANGSSWYGTKLEFTPSMSNEASCNLNGTDTKCTIGVSILAAKNVTVEAQTQKYDTGFHVDTNSTQVKLVGPATISVNTSPTNLASSSFAYTASTAPVPITISGTMPPTGTWINISGTTGTTPTLNGTWQVTNTGASTGTLQGSSSTTGAVGGTAVVNIYEGTDTFNTGTQSGAAAFADASLYAESGSTPTMSIKGLTSGSSISAWSSNSTFPGDVTPTLATMNGGITSLTYSTLTNCSSSGGTCVAAPAGSVSIAAAATTVTVATTKVTANSQIFVQEDSSLGTKLGITCNTTIARIYAVTARTPGTSFVITSSAAPITNPACLSYEIVN